MRVKNIKSNGIVRKARIGDVPAIQLLINNFAQKGKMLPRPLTDIYENIRDFFVFERNRNILGVCALSITWKDLAEIKSLAVLRKFQKKGIGSVLVKSALNEAGNMGIRRIFVLTYSPGFFRKMGFKKVKKDLLPHKIWGECIHCFKFPNCDEEAMILDFKGKKT